MKLQPKHFKAQFATLLVLLGCIAGGANQAKAAPPAWPTNEIIYCVFPEIFSTNGLSGVTAQLGRLHNLGVNVIWLMPFQPRGQAGTYAGQSRPTVNSPYDINNLEGIAPNMGTSSDLTTLIADAHAFGMKVILDVAINQTSWDNPLVENKTQYFLHTDGNVNNVNSTQVGFFYDYDIAGINLTTDQYGAQDYMTNVCKYWLVSYKFDGFRVDSADNPGNSSRTLYQPYAKSLYSTLAAINPNVLLLGEEDDIDLAYAPYGLDYGWATQSALQGVTNGNPATNLQNTYLGQTIGWPSYNMHMAITQDWDMGEDLQMYGGTAQTLDAAAYNYTIPGTPLMFNGEEVGNDDSGLNTHNQIDWNSPNASAFQSFYKSLIALRAGNDALSRGSMAFVANSAPSSVVCYDRISGTNEVFTEINFSGSTVNGTFTAPGGGGAWTDVSPSGSPGGNSHALPYSGNYSLAAHDFAVFKRVLGVTFAPTAVNAVAGNAQVILTWLPVNGATSYNIYRSVTSGGEGATPIKTGVTSTSYSDTGLTNGTKYYYEIAAVNGAGVSPLSTEASATPSTSLINGSITGSVTTVTTTQTYSLTALGTSDWAAYSYNNGFDHDANGGSKISNVTAVGGSLNQFTFNIFNFTWTNGSPDTSASDDDNGYYNQGGLGDGFTFTVPASTTAQKLTVYLGGYNSSGTFTATLSDGSAAAYSNSSLASTNSYFAYYTIDFKAASAGQTLTINWVQNSSGVNVDLYAATLQ